MVAHATSAVANESRIEARIARSVTPSEQLPERGANYYTEIRGVKRSWNRVDAVFVGQLHCASSRRPSNLVLTLRFRLNKPNKPARLSVPHRNVVSLFVGNTAGDLLLAVPQVRAVPGKGLEGDRYFRGVGTFSKSVPQPDFEVTLIEIESIEALRREYGIDLAPHESRRNIVTRGVPLNHFVGQEFKVGEVLLRGHRLCEPCSHLQALTREGVLKGLIHRGGLRAQILSAGVIRVGDAVSLA
jgi:hypothetical protein